MKLEPFALERLQSIWEHNVAWNLAESGVHPLRVEELLESDGDRLNLMAEHLSYSQTNGTAELRATIADMYSGATPANVQVTNGGSEANFIAFTALVQPGAEVVMMLPNYLQLGGLARALGATVRDWPLINDPAADPPRWRADLDALEALVNARTKVIAICNPNNPTGARLTADELDEVCTIASRVGAWVLSDEIYRGAERDASETATVWGRYERAIITSGLSKAFGLPGLRIGWAIAPAPLVEELWGIHDYTTIAPGTINDFLARIALAPARRERLLARTRGIIATNYAVLKKWLDRRAAWLSHVPPEAGAIAFVRYTYPTPSTELAERIREQQSVLIVPGSHFGLDGYLRFGFGGEMELLVAALERVGEVLDGIGRTTG